MNEQRPVPKGFSEVSRKFFEINVDAYNVHPHNTTFHGRYSLGFMKHVSSHKIMGAYISDMNGVEETIFYVPSPIVSHTQLPNK